GKTTLTEKLLLYSGAIEEAGAVGARAGRQRGVTSDWMELERQRGISISSTVVRFEHRGHILNLLDTPGHRDFSEDTYRVLSAVDSAVMVLDAARGIEDQTLKLFQVARRRGIPLITFINKCDRPGLEPLALLDDIERHLSLIPTPLTWPLGGGPEFAGVVDRRDGVIWRFSRTAHGSTAGEERPDPVGLLKTLGAVGATATAELDLLAGVGADHRDQGFLTGSTTPVFFGSALWNFGVRLLLDALVDIAPPPTPRLSAGGVSIPLDAPFVGLVFKVQANLDPQHRDRLAFVRVCAGAFERGMALVNHRTGRVMSTKYANRVFGRERDTMDVAFPGDVIGLVNAGDLAIGDTLSVNGKVALPPMPTLAPEHFMVARSRDSSRYKRFRRGLAELEQEGVIQVLRHAERGDREPILAAVGPLQYDVTQHRLEAEYGASIDLTPTRFVTARRTDKSGAIALAAARGVEILRRSDGTFVALFESRHGLEMILRDQPSILLDPVFAG
ncbi:MAG TPA: peptide chain release factor 3, partial [Actinobacteria bacterium]|nr:peptide chain release factor 3 [Actinomycetota bacterium]